MSFVTILAVEDDSVNRERLLEPLETQGDDA